MICKYTLIHNISCRRVLVRLAHLRIYTQKRPCSMPYPLDHSGCSYLCTRMVYRIQCNELIVHPSPAWHTPFSRTPPKIVLRTRQSNTLSTCSSSSSMVHMFQERSEPPVLGMVHLVQRESFLITVIHISQLLLAILWVRGVCSSYKLARSSESWLPVNQAFSAT